MKRFIIIIITLCLLIGASQSYAMHCGKNLVTKGDHKYEVIAACGQPNSREVIGVDHKHVGEYRIVEEWLYIIERYGHKQMYLLKFDGDGRVREIEWLGEQK